MKFRRIILSLCAAIWIGPPAIGQTAGMLSFQGYLKDANGAPVSGEVELGFRLFDAESEGQLIADYGVIQANVSDGIASAAFGPAVPGQFDGNQRWLEVAVNGEPLSRIAWTTAPATAEQVNVPGTGMSAVFIDEVGNMRIGSPTGEVNVTRPLEIVAPPEDDYATARFRTQNSNLMWQLSPTGAFVLHDNIAESNRIYVGPDGANIGIGDHVRFDRISEDEDRIRVTDDATNHEVWIYGRGLIQCVENGSSRVTLDARQGSVNAEHFLGNDVTVNDSIWAGGQISGSSVQIRGGADLAEPFHVDSLDESSVQPGMVVSINPAASGQLTPSSDPYDRRVAGIISGANGLNPGMVMRATGDPHADGEHPVALTGRVWTWCDASNGPIRPGDLLTTSSTQGHAMRVDEDDCPPRGCIIGKAMTALDAGTGLVLVLVNLQ